jgi:hypothetical protein
MAYTESKAFQIYRSRIDYLNQHLQVIDASLKNTSNWLNNYQIKTKPISEALGLINSDYSQLNHPVKDYNRIFSYTRAKNSEFSLIELYNAFSWYLKDILKCMYEKDPIKIVGKVATQNLSFIDIVNLGSFDRVSEKMINSVFRKLEDEKSTPKLLEKILCHTTITLDDTTKRTALMYLEMRHLIIHNNGKADDKFINDYGALITLRANGKLPTTFDVVTSAMKAVYELAENIDKELIANGLISTR